jgi:hypothetical protein
MDITWPRFAAPARAYCSRPGQNFFRTFAKRAIGVSGKPGRSPCCLNLALRQAGELSRIGGSRWAIAGRPAVGIPDDLSEAIHIGDRGARGRGGCPRDGPVWPRCAGARAAAARASARRTAPGGTKAAGSSSRSRAEAGCARAAETRRGRARPGRARAAGSGGRACAGGNAPAHLFAVGEILRQGQ